MKVAVIAGSKSDEEILNAVCRNLEGFGIAFKSKILSAHRNHEELEEFVQKSDAEVFIAIAGLSAALPGFIVSLTTKPVIGIPVASQNSVAGGLDSLLSIVQMPSGVPVACVGINNARNAAILAAQILSMRYPKLKKILAAAKA